MNSILLLGFDLSLAKLSTPLTISGIVLIVLSIFLVAGAAKIDERIRAKKSSTARGSVDTHSIENGEGLESESCDGERPETIISDDEREQDDVREDIAPRADNMRDADGNMSVMKHSDGTFNYYMLFKIIGLVMVLVSATMIIVGMK